jgi:hypothetical protein
MAKSKSVAAQEFIKLDYFATKIQSAFRGMLHRRRLRQMVSLITLQVRCYELDIYQLSGCSYLGNEFGG